MADAAATPPAAELPAAEVLGAATPTTTFATATEVQRLDVAAMHEKALIILAALKARPTAAGRDAAPHVSVLYYTLQLGGLTGCIVYYTYYIIFLY